MENRPAPLPRAQALLPWATIACLAAALACVGELLSVERARARLYANEAELARAAQRAAEDERDAQRLLARRLGSEATGPLLLRTAAGIIAGAAVWQPDTRTGTLVARVDEALSRIGAGVWLAGASGTEPRRCTVLGQSTQDGILALRFLAPGPVRAGDRFILVAGKAVAGGPPPQASGPDSIVLATPAAAERLSSP